MLIYSFVYAQFTFSLPIQVNEIFLDDGPKFYGLLMTVNALTVVFLTPVITSITIKYKPIMVIFLGGIQYAIGFGILYFISSMPLLALSTVLWTAGEVLVNTNSGVYIANNTPISHRGRFNSVFPVLISSGFAFGPYIIGPYIDAFGTRQVWVLCFILASGASLLMICLNLLEGFYTKRKRGMNP
jgi:MFS family permease